MIFCPSVFLHRIKAQLRVFNQKLKTKQFSILVFNYRKTASFLTIDCWKFTLTGAINCSRAYLTKFTPGTHQLIVLFSWQENKGIFQISFFLVKQIKSNYFRLTLRINKILIILHSVFGLFVLIRLNAFVLSSSWELIVKSSMPGFEKRFFFQSVIIVHKLYRPQKHFFNKK